MKKILTSKQGTQNNAQREVTSKDIKEENDLIPFGKPTQEAGRNE